MKNSKWFIPGIVLAVVALLFMMFSGTYNSLVGSRESVKRSLGDLQSAYQRRNDLIPNLVETVKGSGQFEQTTLTQVMEARSKATQTTIDVNNATPEQIKAYQEAQAGAGSALNRLLAVAEAYPELKTTQAYQDLMNQLEGTENRINQARNDYNKIAEPYNARIQTFPTNIIAGLFGFKQFGYFQADPGADKAPKVDFGTSSATKQ